MKITAITVLAIILSCIPVTSLGQMSGTHNYGMGESSVMRNRGVSALFLNPGELARIHNQELYISANRFSEMPGIGVAHFVPSLGTFAFGIGNEFGISQYSLGFGKIFYDYQTVGGAINYISGPGTDDVTLSLGTTIHLPEAEGKNSGLLLGVSAIDFSSNTSLVSQRFMAGAGYWFLPRKLILQGSWLYENQESKLAFGGEYILSPQIAIQAGTKQFEEVSAGIRYKLPAMNLDLSAGKLGISFSVSFRINEDPEIIRDNNYDRGIKSYTQENYAEAKEAFKISLDYDEYFEPARTYINLSQGVNETTTRLWLKEAEAHERDGNYLDAKKNYTKVLKSFPDNIMAKSRLIGIQPHLEKEATQIATVADSLVVKEKYDAAREQYLLAFEYNPEDEGILQRLSSMERLIADSVAFYLASGNASLEKNQLDGAQKSYGKVLEFNPGNPEAEKNLSIVENRKRTAQNVVKTTRITKESFEKGKSAFDSQNYFDAISYFADYLKIDPKNSEAEDYINRSRELLKPKIESYFKLGLQYYVDENYKQALEVWNRALIISPDHKAIIEYKKRAELKMDALEKLK